MIIKNNDINKEQWNNLVNNHPYYRFEWMDIIKKVYGLEPLFILISNGAYFALIASFKTHKGFISLPFISYSGFVSNDETTLKELKDYLSNQEILIDSRYLLMEEKDHGYVNPIVDINSFESFWNNISRNTRNQFRKSEKSNIGFMIEKKVDNVYTLYAINMHRLGTPVHKKTFFQELKYNMDVVIFTIYDDAKPIGSMFCFYDQTTLYVAFASTLTEYNKKYANYFLYLNAIKWMCDNNLTKLDLGRSTYGQGTFHFKKKFRPTFYGIKSNINYSGNKKMKLASYIWQKLPLPVANFIGPKIRKFLP